MLFFFLLIHLSICNIPTFGIIAKPIKMLFNPVLHPHYQKRLFSEKIKYFNNSLRFLESLTFGIPITYQLLNCE